MMPTKFRLVAALISASGFVFTTHGAPADARGRPYQVGAFYYGPWHVDPHNEKLHGANWTEWNLLKQAKPRFPGHLQPNVPAWGCQTGLLTQWGGVFT
jgi:hypothetical protein